MDKVKNDIRKGEMKVNEYEVIVVGAGPAGCAAAKAAAERGVKTILLEEHAEIGVPQHCCGAFFSFGVQPARFKEFVQTLDRRIVLSEYTTRYAYAPSGKVVHEVSVAGTGACLVRRSLLDRELAEQAVKAGADLRLNIHVSGLLKQNGRIIGVTTSSGDMEKVYGKVVISAEGIHGTQKGIPKSEKLNRSRQAITAGISLELTRCRDLEPNVAEMHFGAFCDKGWVTVWPRNHVSCTTQLGSLAEFEKIKTGNYALSKKLRDAIPLRMVGYSHTADLGQGLPKIVEDGLILAGSAGGWLGNWTAIVSGGYAGEVAALAICEGDVTVKKLSKYEELCKELRQEGRPFLMAFRLLSDEAIENLLPEMIEKGEVLR